MSSIRLREAQGRWVLAATVLASGLAMLDATIVNVALPPIGRQLGASMTGLQWTVNAYTLTLAGLILLGGALGDMYGRRKVFLIGVVWFAIASLLCGLAPNIEVLIAARALQGVGGALLTPGSLAIIQASFRQEDRAPAVGAWSGLGGVAGAIGPFLGGWIIQTAGWRWAFLLNLPVAALVIAVSLKHVPESKDESAHTHSFDIAGAVLAFLALAGVTYALTGDGAAGAVGAGVTGAAAAVAFVIVERRRSSGVGPSPMLPLDLFTSRQFSAINVVTFVVYGAMSVMFFLFVLQLQVVSKFDPIAAGTALLPVTILMLLLSSRAGALAQRIGPRLLISAGLILAAAGMVWMTRIGAGASYLIDVLPPVTLFGLGLSAIVAPLTATVLATADVRHAGVASGVNNAVARAAGLFAVAGIPPLVGLTGEAYNNPASFGRGFVTAMLISAALMAAGAVLTWFTVRDDVLRTCPDQARPQAKSHCAVAGPPLEPARSATTE